jgi:hypothetical protein
VKTAEDGWLPEVRNLEDYAGIDGHAVIDLAVRIDKGSLWYQAHVINGDWCKLVTGYDVNDPQNGYAGVDAPIDLIRCYIDAPGKDKVIAYRVAPVGGDYFDWQRDDETDKGQDGYAGLSGFAISRVQMVVRDY